MSPIQLTVEELKSAEDRGKAPTMTPPRRKRRMRSQDSTKRLVFGGMPSNPKGITTTTTKEAIGEVVDHLSITLCTLLDYALGVTWDNLKKLDKAALLQKMVEDQTQVRIELCAKMGRIQAMIDALQDERNRLTRQVKACSDEESKSSSLSKD
ncbi:hypothetical protein Pint_13968 [Pistacia integerrima]|uniref:Uncharacterized protein n=1 Tax=Pistacia integerrima TaxID=434235 RepID=A0ACC0Y6Z0_9ROSI|nr:hypothetical protein Pint_13968 [Pistacia integerrima]